MTEAPAWVLPAQMSSTRPSLLLIVPSTSNCHCWLGPPWCWATRSWPLYTSSTLETKIPHFKIFLFLGNVNQFARSHWFSYCLHECKNEWINGSLVIWTTALKQGTLSCGMWGPDVRYKWDVSEEPATLRWRQSDLHKNVNLLPDYEVSHSGRHPSYRSLWERWKSNHLCTWLTESISNGYFSGSSGVPKRGGFGGSTPPEFQRPSKIVPKSNRLWKLLKIGEFRTPTPHDVRKKGSKFLKLRRFAIVLH